MFFCLLSSYENNINTWMSSYNFNLTDVCIRLGGIAIIDRQRHFWSRE